tara:strand:+ start:97 stop:1074 length:978 start_codon:yes stop_codon:yes gene_type:complete
MSKFVNVPNGDFTVKVQDNGTIRLDTGAGIGEVRVTGNLVIEGTTTTVNSTNLEIEDNILTLNRGETSNGVGEGTAGIQIDRGTASDGDAQILFDESIEHVNPNAPSTQVFGTFKFVRTDGQMVGIRAPSIQTGGGQLYLDTNNQPVTIIGNSTQYAQNINGQDEALVNVEYVDLAIQQTLSDLAITKIASGNTIVEATDATDGSNESRVDFMMDSSVVSTFFPDRIELNEIRIKNSTISGTVSNGDLELEAPGTGTVLIKDVLQIAETPGTDDFAIDPLAPTNGVKVYAKSEGPGNTGLYYVNTNNERDELISRNRALLFGYLL